MEWRGSLSRYVATTAGEHQRLDPAWADRKGIRLEYIQPGKPQQNAYVERFNRTVRYEWLSQYLWEDLDEVRLFATQWMYNYNHHRPHMALAASPRNSGWPWPRSSTSARR